MENNRIEKIGKVTLDYAHYPGEDFYCDGAIEDELLEIVKNVPQENYPGVIREKRSWEVLYHLSDLRENIVEWLPMDKSMKVLEVGSGCGAITGSFSRKAGSVTCVDLSRKRSLINAYRHKDCDNVTIHVGNFQDIEPDLTTDFDYVCLIGVFEYGQCYIGGETPFTDFYNIIKKHVKPGGRIAIAIENKMGLKYWAGCREDHLGTFFSGLEDYAEGGVVRTFTRGGLEKILRDCGETDIHFYYPYPDYKFMTMVYSDRYLPKVGELSNNLRNFDRDRMLLFDEKVFDMLIRENLFPLYSNSFMVLTGPEPEVAYSRFSNDRARHFSIRTDIASAKDGQKVVRKYAANEAAQKHVQQLAENGKVFAAQFAGSSLAVNLLEEKQDAQGQKFVQAEFLEAAVTLEELLDECLQKNEETRFQALFDRYLTVLDWAEKKELQDFDLIFPNIMVQGENWTVIDYEWTCRGLSARQMTRRALFCYVLENEKRKESPILQKVLGQLGMDEDAFAELLAEELTFQKTIMTEDDGAERTALTDMRHLIGHMAVPAQEFFARADRKKVQIFEDFGAGYSPEHSYYIHNAYLADDWIKAEIACPKGIRGIRLDPAEVPCIVRLKQVVYNGRTLTAEQLNQAIVTNGMPLAEGAGADTSVLFDTNDPNINVRLDALADGKNAGPAEGKLVMEAQVSWLSAEMLADLKGAFDEEETPLVSKIKNALQQNLLKKQYRWYENQITEQTISYHDWIVEKEKQERECLSLKGKELKLEVISYNECNASFDFSHYKNADILVFHEEDGTPDMRELALVADYFARHPETVVLYADEDEMDAKGVRSNPWLKPDWSPDTLISYFYFGGFFAVHREECSHLEWLGEKDARRNLYDFALKAVEITGRAAHVDCVLFHRNSKIEPWGDEECYDDLKRSAYLRRGWPLVPTGKVSIIIPNKDNPGVLSTCIHSVLEASTYRDFEIIVVDNGSSAHNKARIEMMREMLQPEHRFVYHYEPMEFNFSKMCNIGVSMATGDYILLLNNDIEIIQENWLEKMMEKAVLPHVGAVGVKLIYPTTEIIQHAGITNIHLGPAHKLQFRSDANEYYFKKNRLAFDMLGVTGACLLVKKSIYEEAGGFDEKLRVAFNDVEFCYHLHDLGYVNVARNDVTLIHHESLSRGADDSTEKLRRLHQELNYLYEKHPSVYGTDPYYHRYLVKDVLDAEFLTGNLYDFDKRMERVAPQKMENYLAPEWHNEVLRMGIEFAGDMNRWQTGKSGGGDWLIQGWSWALMVDNCRYSFNVLLKPVEKGYIAPGSSEAAMPEDHELVWKLPCKRQYRPDIDANLHGIPNTKLPGVCVAFDRASLPAGDYLIGFMWEDRCSRQKLYRFSAETLSVE